MTFSELVAKGQAFWESIPGPLKTIINVTIGAGVAAGAVYLKSLNGGPVDISLLWAAVVTGATTAFWRAINPFDAQYGWGKSIAANIGGTPAVTAGVASAGSAGAVITTDQGDVSVQDDEATDHTVTPVPDRDIEEPVDGSDR